MSKKKKTLIIPPGVERLGPLDQILLAEAGFHDPVKLKDCHKPTVIVIDDEKPVEKILEINGVQYRKRPDKKPFSKRTSSLMTMAVTLSALQYGNNTPTPRKRPTINIEEEFGKIGRKESNLSRSDRDWVCNQFNYLYEKI